jgi:small subunit ribosomal protein S5
MRFRACVVVGDRKGRVGVGVAKGLDVAQAMAKAANQAKRNLHPVLLDRKTIPHRVQAKEGAAVVLLKPAPLGTGIIAGGVVRTILEVAGVENVSSKILGSKNKINNARATLRALEQLRPRPQRIENKEVGIRNKADDEAVSEIPNS